jgi:hypothetical protein
MTEPKRKPIINPIAGMKFNLDLGEKNEAAFEDSTVMYLLNAFGLSKIKWDLIRQHEQNTGEKKLTLLDFCYHYDTFPMVLQSAVSGMAKTNKVNKLFTVGSRGSVLSLEGTLYKKWKEIRDDLPRDFQGRPFGLVAKWAHIPRGLLFHTMGDLGTNGVRLHWRERRLEMTVEPLEQFVGWLKTNWSP